jgi:hypothetical protein
LEHLLRSVLRLFRQIRGFVRDRLLRLLRNLLRCLLRCLLRLVLESLPGLELEAETEPGGRTTA